MVEVALVAVVLSAGFLALLQLGLALHARTVLTAAAADGARYAAEAGRSPGEGARRAVVEARQALPGLHPRARAGVEQVGGRQTVVVTLRARLPLLGVIGPSGALVVRAHALAEGGP